jgi:hypothetical protein
LPGISSGPDGQGRNQLATLSRHGLHLADQPVHGSGRGIRLGADAAEQSKRGAPPIAVRRSIMVLSRTLPVDAS